MKLYKYCVTRSVKQLRLWIYERNVSWTKNFVYEIFVLSGDCDIPLIGQQAANVETLMKKNFPGYKCKEECCEEVSDKINERIHYLFDGKINAKELEEIFCFSKDELTSLLRINPSIQIEDGIFDKWEIESLLKSQNICTRTEIAIELGLYERDLDRVFDFLRHFMLLPSFLPQKQEKFISKDVKKRLESTLFPDVIFESQNDFLVKFFDFLNEKNNLKVQRCFCFVSKSLKEKERKNPAHIDILLNLPVSEEFSIAIKNDKPGYLPPDYVSFYSYLIKEKELTDWRLFPDTRDFEKCLEDIRKIK